jgi:hypothetical protein
MGKTRVLSFALNSGEIGYAKNIHRGTDEERDDRRAWKWLF